MHERTRMIRAAIVGMGSWGRNLVTSVQGRSDVLRFTVGATRTPAKAADFAAAHGIRMLPGYDAVLSDPTVDAVVLATPHSQHAEEIAAAARAGKHVFVEKPLAMTVEDAARVVALAERQQRVLMVGHTFLYNAAVRRLREYITSGELGDIFYLYSQRLNLGRVRRDVNALWNFGPHDVSILLYLLDASPHEVSARGFAYLQPDVEDVVFMTATFPGGISAHVHISWLDPHKVRRMTVVGSRKMVVYDDASVDARIVLYDRGVDRVPTVDSPRDFGSFAEFQLALRRGDITIPALKFPEPLQVECQHFVDCIVDGRAPLTGGQHALEVVKVLEAAQRSLDADGRSVRIEPSPA